MKNVLNLCAFACVFFTGSVKAQQNTDSTRWEFVASANANFFPGGERIMLPIFTADHDWLHVQTVHGAQSQVAILPAHEFRRKSGAQYAGFGTAKATNERFRLLLDAGQTGLSVAFDLPTQMGIDSSSPRAMGEVGRVGVAIDTVDDMHLLLDGIPLDKVSTSMTINATASTLLAMYIVVAEERGMARASLSGTVQNDILKEYIARGTYIYPPAPSLALTAEMFRFCAAEVPLWNPISISGYHIREAGSTAVQELAFTFADALAYVQQAVDAGLAVDAFAPRLSFFFAAHSDVFEEVAKFRAARRMWARLMRERFGANDNSCRLRFHTQTGGVTLTAQQPLNNVVRVTLQALAAALGGTQSLHTNGYDEALALPTAQAATTVKN